MAIHCTECGDKLNTVQEAQDHKRRVHPIAIDVVVPDGVRYRVQTGPFKEVVVSVLDDSIPVRILRPDSY